MPGMRIGMQLQKFETRELIDEVLGRFDSALFTGLTIDAEDGTEETIAHWRGGVYACAGLAEAANRRLMKVAIEE